METSNSFIEQLREKYEIFELWRNAVGVCYKIEIKVVSLHHETATKQFR